MFDIPLSEDFRKRKVKKEKKEIEPQEILLDALAQKKEAELGISEQKFEVPLSKKIFQGVFITFFILIFFLFAKTFQLQVFQNKELFLQAEEQSQRIYYLRSERGVIYDRNLKQLVWNEASFDLVADIKDLPKNEEEQLRMFKEISGILGESSGDLKEKIEKTDAKKVLISENISHDTLILLEIKINSGEFPGFRIEENVVRNYLNSPNISHLIGYIGRINQEELSVAQNYSFTDLIGKSGVEKSYEETLRGKPGILKIKKDALGKEKEREEQSQPEAGKSLVLWLDTGLQEKIEEELGRILKEVDSKKAAAVALDPRTGGVLALVSYPAFDNNLFSGENPEELKKFMEAPSTLELKPFFNRVISGKYLTGSTIKPLIASAALEEKIISPDKKINDSEGKIVVQDYWNPEKTWEYKDWKIHGWTDMRKAIAESCNVYFYTVGGGYGDQEGLGPTKIKEYLEKFGWNQKTGIDLPWESEGFIPDKDWKKRTLGQGWWDGDTYNLSIGQGFLKITPLEVVTAFSAIANGGKLLQPQVVQKIIGSEKNLGEEDKSSSSPFAEARVIEEFKPKIIRENFIDPKNLQIVREGMRQAVTAGSATGWLDTLSVSAAAKTGTAELGGDYYHNWVTVFAPYEDPQIVLTILIENVEGMKPAALPVAKEVLKWYFGQK